MSHLPPAASRRLVAIAGVAACAAVLAACGSSSGSSPAGAAGSPSPSTSGGEGGTGARPSFGAGFTTVTGKVASVGSQGAKVTTSKGDTDVAFAASTRFTTVASASLSSIAVGDCVTASSITPGTRPTPAATPSPRKAGTPIKATSISITSTSGCPTGRAGGFGGGSGGSGGGFGGGFGGGAPGSGTVPNGIPSPGAAPDAVPSGAPGSTGRGGVGRGGFGAAGFGAGFGIGAMGTVTAVSGSTVTLKPAFGTTTAKTTVTTTAATTYSSRTTGKAGDVTTGRCLTAVGQTVKSIVDAVVVTVSDPVNGTCVAQAGFGGGTFAGGRGIGGPLGGTGGNGVVNG